MAMTYYVDYPRNFANEYAVYAVAPADAADFAAAFPDAARVTRAEAIRLGWGRPRQARRDGEQWFGGFAGERPVFTLEEALQECRRATAARLAEVVGA